MTDSVITIGSKTDQEVTCSSCGKQGVTGEFYTYQGEKGVDVYLCPDCRAKVNDTLINEEKNIPTWRAFGLGLLASVVGAVIWYYITVLTDHEYGYVSLGLGYLVGYAVLMGAGKRRGKKLQIISALLVTLGIFVAEYAIFSHNLHIYMATNPSQFDWWDGQPLWVDPWNPLFLESLASPIGLLIYAIGIYLGYMVCKPQKL